MFRCWSPAYVEEENCLSYDDFDSLKEWLVHPDHLQLQNPSDLGITSLDSHELQYSDVKREQKDQILESSIDVKMEKVSLVEISDRGQEEVELVENRGGRDEYMKWVKPPGLEELKVIDLKSDLPNKEGCLEERSDGKGLDDLKSDLPNEEGSLKDGSDEGGLDDLKSDLRNMEGSLEDESHEGGLDDLKSDLPNTEGNLGEESNEEGSTSEEAEADSGDSSSDEVSSDKSDESMSVTKSLSSSEDEDGGLKKREEGEDFEEGEVRGFDAHRVDFLSDEEGEGQKGPIRSKHEPEDLPPVPMVEVSLQPHHQMLPVGIISSIMSNRVIVEGSVLHNPLNEGSILWVTETRFPLGLVDEIFGPVKNPYYVVRYNAEEEVPAGIGVGIDISFVREFASQILNEKELYKKGYDASGENDEEVDSEEEFSDDEQELMHKKSLREGKRVINHCEGVKQEAKFERRRKAYMGPRDQHKDIQKQSSCVQTSMHQLHPTVQVLPQPAQLGPGSWSSSSGATNADLIPPSTMPQFLPQAIQTVNYVGNPSQQLTCNPSHQLVGNPSRQLLTQHQNTQWFPGFSPQLQNTGLHGDLPMQLQNQNAILNNLVNMMAFQQLLQQFVPHQGSNLPWVGAAPSLQALGQNNFAPSPFNNGFINDQIQGPVPLPFAPSMQFNAGNSSSLHFNGGSSSSRGRRPYQRGGGRFFDRGGRQPNR